MSFAALSRRRLPAVVGMLLLTMILAGCLTGPAAPSAVTLIYAGGLNGNLAGCDCWGYPVAGLDKSARYLKGISADAATLRFSTGNIFEPGEDRLQAGLILTSLSELGFNLIGIGPQEFANGFEALADWSVEYPLLSHNLSYETQRGPFPGARSEPLRFTRGGVRIEVLSLTDPALFSAYPREFRERLTIADPASVAASLWPGKDNETVRVILFTGDRDAALELAGSVAAQLILYSPREEPRCEKLADGTIAASAGLDGNSLGLLRIEQRGRGLTLVPAGSVAFDYLSSPADPVVAKRAEEYVRILRERIAGASDGANQ